jgi:hypothetical protein
MLRLIAERGLGRTAKFFVPPAAILCIGFAFLGGVLGSVHDADVYRHAAPCGDTVDPYANCYRVEQATITRIDVLEGRSSTTIDLDLEVGARTYRTYVDPGGGPRQYGLATGSSVTVQLYHNLIARIDTPGHRLEARDSPARSQRDLLLGAVVFLSIGGVYAYFAWMIYQFPVVPMAFKPYRIQHRAPMPVRIARLAARRRKSAASASIPLVLRALASNGPPLFQPRPVLIPVLILLGLAAVGMPAYRVGIVLGVVLVGMAVVYHWLYVHTASIFVDNDQVGTRNWVFTRQLPRSAIAAVVLRAIDRGMRHTSPRIFLVDAEGRSRLHIGADFYRREDVSRLAAALDVPIEGGWNRVINKRTLHVEIPGSASWVERNAMLAAAILVGGAIVVGSVLLVVAGR